MENGLPVFAPPVQDVPPGYTIRIFNNEKYIVPNYAVKGLEATMAARDERQRFETDSVPLTVS